jgi:septal ring factor EnvC (AmiA/AmiB activator)
MFSRESIHMLNLTSNPSYLGMLSDRELAEKANYQENPLAYALASRLREASTAVIREYKDEISDLEQSLSDVEDERDELSKENDELKDEIEKLEQQLIDALGEGEDQ